MPLRIPRDEPPSLNMTPMIDIVFLLIIFFMVGTRFTEFSEKEKEIDLNVPEVRDANSLAAPPAKRQINVFREGRITLDNEPVSLDELSIRLASEKREHSALGVIVRGDSQVIYQQIADVLAACRRAGVADVGISVRVASRE
jgi:biopolymer transport protein ExbD